MTENNEVVRRIGPLGNSRHELYAQGLFQGKTSIQAFGDAGFVRNANNASRLRANEKVIARLAELHARTVLSINISENWILEQLLDVVFIAKSMEKPDLTNANRALNLIGLHIGMFVERKEIGRPGDFDGLSIADKRERIMGVAKLLGLGFIGEDGQYRLGANIMPSISYLASPKPPTDVEPE